jgi:RimJ/RimL family protein N-acetyltransferase
MTPATQQDFQSPPRAPPDMHILHAEGMTLEPQTAAHADAMFVVLSDPALYEYENAPPQSVKRLRERFAKLESRRSPDGAEQWLNWVIRQEEGDVIGYVQATIRSEGYAAIAYEIGSQYWGRSLARRAVEAMMDELRQHYDVRRVVAVLKGENGRSMRLLQRLAFTPAPTDVQVPLRPDEVYMHRAL